MIYIWTTDNNDRRDEIAALLLEYMHTENDTSSLKNLMKTCTNKHKTVVTRETMMRKFTVSEFSNTPAFSRLNHMSNPAHFSGQWFYLWKLVCEKTVRGISKTDLKRNSVVAYPSQV